MSKRVIDHAANPPQVHKSSPLLQAASSGVAPDRAALIFQ